MLIEMSAKLIAEQMPVCREVMDVIAARFNTTTEYRWGRIIDFLKLHYALTQRDDSAFWRDNRLPGNDPPERLQHLLLLWRYQSPWYHDEFDRIEEVFPAARAIGMCCMAWVSHRRWSWGSSLRGGASAGARDARQSVAD